MSYALEFKLDKVCAILERIDKRLARLEQQGSATNAQTRPLGGGKMQEVCPGCGVSVGQSCWDNCSMHPAFSQPIFYGNGRYSK